MPQVHLVGGRGFWYRGREPSRSAHLALPSSGALCPSSSVCLTEVAAVLAVDTRDYDPFRLDTGLQPSGLRPGLPSCPEFSPVTAAPTLFCLVLLLGDLLSAVPAQSCVLGCEPAWRPASFVGESDPWTST